MEGVLFMLGTVVIEGGLVALIMSLFTQEERRNSREDEYLRRLADLEQHGNSLGKAA